jgi:hypothetical protein
MMSIQTTRIEVEVEVEAEVEAESAPQITQIFQLLIIN